MRPAASPPNPPRANNLIGDRAEQLRRHREEFQLAMREGISLPEAKLRLHEERMARINAEREARLGRPSPAGAEQPEKPIPWWKRDDL